MQVIRLVLVVLAALMVTIPAPPPASANAAIEQLLANVQYWEERGRPDKAAEVWQKILRSDPSHADALAALALYHARRGQKPKAEGYLKKLEKVNSSHRRLGAIRKALGLGKEEGQNYDAMLADARAKVKAGQVGEAIALYRKIGAHEGNPGLQLEFYQTLGGSPGGWEEARDGLQRLADGSPDNGRFQVAYAEHLTYRAGSRRDGIKRLQVQAGRGGKWGKRATSSWKKALGWLSAKKADIPLFRAYLDQHSDDADIRKKYAELKNVGRATPKEVRETRLNEGFAALTDKDTAKAEEIFDRAVKKSRNDADALVGLASVALQREDFAEARKILLRVKKLKPKNPEMWEQSLESAEFWGLVKSAQTDANEEKWEQAEDKLLKAMRRSPNQAGHARLELANILVRKGAYAEAETAFNAILEEKPGDPDAQRALVELYLAQKKGAEAIAANARLMEVDPERAYAEDWLEAEVLRHRAKERAEDGDIDGAWELLRIAAEKSPKNRRVGYDAFYLALDMGELRLARKYADALQEEVPEDEKATVKEALAWLYARQQRYRLALDVLRQVPKTAMTEDLLKLERRLEVQSDTADAMRQAQRGKPLAARHRLTQLQAKMTDDPELLAHVALAWADLGSFDRAEQLIYDALSRMEGDAEAKSMKLQLAAILHRAGKESELLSVLRELSSESALTPGEQRGLADLKIAYTVRKADQAREKGAFARAYNILSIPLKEYPNDHRRFA